MRCPTPTCQSTRIHNRNTYTASEDLGIPAEFKLLNITRRRKKCAACNQIFFTIELSEAEFRRLTRTTGRLEGAQAAVRPNLRLNK